MSVCRVQGPDDKDDKDIMDIRHIAQQVTPLRGGQMPAAVSHSRYLFGEGGLECPPSCPRACRCCRWRHRPRGCCQLGRRWGPPCRGVVFVCVVRIVGRRGLMSGVRGGGGGGGGVCHPALRAFCCLCFSTDRPPPGTRRDLPVTMGGTWNTVRPRTGKVENPSPHWVLAFWRPEGPFLSPIWGGSVGRKPNHGHMGYAARFPV